MISLEPGCRGGETVHEKRRRDGGRRRASTAAKWRKPLRSRWRPSHRLAVAQPGDILLHDYFLSRKLLPMAPFARFGGPCLSPQDFDELTIARPGLDRRSPRLAVFHEKTEGLIPLGHIAFRDHGGNGQGPDVGVLSGN